MSHRSQRAFIESCRDAFPEFFRNASVLEIGSGDINGSPRTLFQSSRYIGVDVTSGPGVDLIASGHEVSLGAGTFDTVLSCECLEHNPYWKETIANMATHLKPGGLMMLTCATLGRPEHGTPRSQPSYSLSTREAWNYYRNISKRELTLAMADLRPELSFRIFAIPSEADLYVVGIADPSSELRKRLEAFLPRCESDKSFAMRSFLAASGILEKFCFVSPYLLSKILLLLQRTARKIKGI